MKRININVTCSYTVEIECDIPDEVVSQLEAICDNGGRISDDELDNPKAMDWLADHINESDAMD